MADTTIGTATTTATTFRPASSGGGLGSVQLSGSLLSVNGSGATGYCGNALDFSSPNPMKFSTSARTISKLRATLRANAGMGVAMAVTLFKNGVATAMTVSVPSGGASGTEYKDLAHPITFADDDDFDVQMSAATDGAPGTDQISVSLE